MISVTRPNRFVFLAVLTALAVAPLWAAQMAAQGDRTKQLGLKVKCMCRGCDMSAGGCSHPGGAFSGPCETAKGMLKEVDQHIAKGETDEQVLQAFVQEYGSSVLIEPPKKGFGLVAWAMPVFYIVLGVALVVFVINKWRKQGVASTASAVAGGDIKMSREPLDDMRARIARETED